MGGCDALLTARPLAPVTEIAGQADGELAKIMGTGAAPADLLAALAQDLRPGPPAVIVLEDMHWADEATLDLLRVLGRRIEALPAMVIVTYRDGLDRTHPLWTCSNACPPDLSWPWLTATWVSWACSPETGSAR